MIEFIFENWLILAGMVGTPLGIFFGYLFGGKQAQNIELKKNIAIANQENVKTKRDMADLESEIYTRLTERMDRELVERDSEISQLKAVQKELQVTVELQVGTIKTLQNMVENYKATCDDCQFKVSKTKKTKLQ